MGLWLIKDLVKCVLYSILLSVYLHRHRHTESTWTIKTKQMGGGALAFAETPDARSFFCSSFLCS